jgi:hypothetical protein
MYYSVALGELVVSVLATGPKGSIPTEVDVFLRVIKNPEHHFLRRVSKAVGPIS